MSESFNERDRITRLVLDEEGRPRRTPEVEQERAVAIYDLLEDNRFRLEPGANGPYDVMLGYRENRLILDIAEAGRIPAERRPLHVLALSVTPFRRLISDYFMVCETYFEAIKRESPTRIEAIDMGRRAVHNEGAELLAERLSGKITMDHDTARRLFTLVCVLQIRG